MAWEDPVTSWEQSSRLTADDCNRIRGNILYMDNSATVPESVTNDTFLTDAWLSTVLTSTNAVCTAIGIQTEEVTLGWTYPVFNYIEGKLLECYDRVADLLRQQPLTIYAGEIYSGQGDYYGGGY